MFCSKCENEDEKTFKEEESIQVLRMLGLIENIWLLQKYYGRKHEPRI